MQLYNFIDMCFVVGNHCLFKECLSVQRKNAPLRKALLPYFRAKKQRERSKLSPFPSLAAKARKSFVAMVKVHVWIFLHTRIVIHLSSRISLHGCGDPIHSPPQWIVGPKSMAPKRLEHYFSHQYGRYPL